MATVKLKSFPLSEEAECPKCKQQITLYDPAGSEYCMCPKCHNFLRFNAYDNPVVQRQLPPIQQQPILKLGSVGLFDEHQFKVIGYAEKKEKNTRYAWREYLLYNPEKGYANFSEFDGHWNFVAGKNFYEPLEKLSNNDWSFIEYEGYEYNLFNKYVAVTTAVIGEFDWDIVQDQPHVAEFVAPPLIIYKEKEKKGAPTAEFYLGRYVEASEIAEAFKVDKSLFPQKVGIGANQPSKFVERWQAIKVIMPVAIILMAAIALLVSIINPSHNVMDSDIAILPDTTKANEFKPVVTPSFELTNKSSALDLLVSSGVDNNWLEATVVLVNEKDNQTWETTESIEYYHGVEDGESWSEGSHDGSVLLADIPAGKYHLNVYPASGEAGAKNIHITLTANPIIWRNIWLTMLLLLLYPIYVWLMMLNYEKQRWSNSDYSPYHT